VSVTIRHDRRAAGKGRRQYWRGPAGEGWPYPRRDVCGRAPANWCGHAAALCYHLVAAPSRIAGHHQPKGCVRLHVKRGPNRAFMTEIAYIKEESPGSEPLGGGVGAAATRKRPGLRPSYQSGHARAGWPPCWLRTSVPLPRPNIAGGHIRTLIMDASPGPQVAVAAKALTFLLNPRTSI